MNQGDRMPSRRSAAANWAPLARFIAADEKIAQWAGKRPATAFVYEFVRFGLKQGWPCLYGGAMVGLLIATSLWYPRNAPLSRYDFLFLAALAIQIAMLAFRLETFRGSQGHPDLPHRRHPDGAVQDRGRLVDLSRSRVLAHRRRAVVLRIHVCLGRQLHRAFVAAVRFPLRSPSASVGAVCSVRRHLHSFLFPPLFRRHPPRSVRGAGASLWPPVGL